MPSRLVAFAICLVVTTVLAQSVPDLTLGEAHAYSCGSDGTPPFEAADVVADGVVLPAPR